MRAEFAPDRRRFLKAGLVGGIVAARDEARADESPPTTPPFALSELTIDELQRRMKSGELSARALAEKYLARIEAIDRAGPALRSVIEVNPDALSIGDELDKERQAKGPRGPLHGIPILAKDNIDTADRMATTAGSLALVGAKPLRDAFVVARLRQAGAVLLGKTNLSEWANIRCSYSTSGWSGRGGLTRNPYALDRNPSGSSSGSSVAVAANLCAAAIGTETDGSVVSPSSVNGIVGIKPTVGLISRSGVIPISHTQDTTGPMARTVRDAAILLGGMVGTDADDRATAGAKPVADYTSFLDADGLKGARIGVARNYFGFHDLVDAVLAEALNALKNRGAILIDPADVPNMDKVGEFETTVLHYELKADLNAYLMRPGYRAPVRTLKEIIAFNERHKDKEMPYFGQNTFVKAEAKGPLSDKEYLDALANCRRLTRKEGIDAVMDKHKLDALVAPTEGPGCLTDLVVGDRFLSSSSTAAAAAGYPSITVPAGFVFGLPIGLSFFGRAWSEPMLLKLAFAFEQATKARKPPQFRPSAELHRLR
ncbi:MAG: amidase [Gemmataceae bacterium]